MFQICNTDLKQKHLQIDMEHLDGYDIFIYRYLIISTTKRNYNVKALDLLVYYKHFPNDKIDEFEIHFKF